MIAILLRKTLSSQSALNKTKCRYERDRTGDKLPFFGRQRTWEPGLVGENITFPGLDQQWCTTVSSCWTKLQRYCNFFIVRFIFTYIRYLHSVSMAILVNWMMKKCLCVSYWSHQLLCLNVHVNLYFLISFVHGQRGYTLFQMYKCQYMI